VWRTAERGGITSRPVRDSPAGTARAIR
jgi:hypothetical protein